MTYLADLPKVPVHYFNPGTMLFDELGELHDIVSAGWYWLECEVETSPLGLIKYVQPTYSRKLITAHGPFQTESEAWNEHNRIRYNEMRSCQHQTKSSEQK